MKHIFTLALLACTLHTSLTYSPLAAPQADISLDEESLIHDTNWRAASQAYYESIRQLSTFLRRAPLSESNKPLIYAVSFHRAQTQHIPITILIDALIDCAAINDVNDLHLFCTNLNIELSERQRDHYTRHLQELSDLDARLSNAVSLNIVSVIKSCLEQGARINSQCGERTPLMVAIDVGALSSVELLLQNPINLNVQDGFGRTALMRAIEHGNKEIMLLFLQNPDVDVHDLDVTIEDEYGHSALDYAQMYYHKDIEKLLLQDPRTKKPCRCTLL